MPRKSFALFFLVGFLAVSSLCADEPPKRLCPDPKDSDATFDWCANEASALSAVGLSNDFKAEQERAADESAMRTLLLHKRVRWQVAVSSIDSESHAVHLANALWLHHNVLIQDKHTQSEIVLPIGKAGIPVELAKGLSIGQIVTVSATVAEAKIESHTFHSYFTLTDVKLLPKP